MDFISWPPLITVAITLTSKGAASPGSGHGRIGVMGALVFFSSEAVYDKLCSP